MSGSGPNFAPPKSELESAGHALASECRQQIVSTILASDNVAGS